MHDTAFLLVVVFIAYNVDAQIPIPCANVESLTERLCCPVPDPNTFENAGPCGANLGRGSCQPIAIPDSEFNPAETDVRLNWPIQYFNSTCVCAERFGGYDCGECSYAYNDGTTDCEKKTVRARRSVADLTDDDWKEYRAILLQAKATPSRYMAVTIDFTTDLQLLVNSMVNPSVYSLFVWVHYHISKDTGVTAGSDHFFDLAHQASGFPTWHRLLILWFEKEIQTMLGDHLFRFHYWNWLDPEQRDVPFKTDRLGENIDGRAVGDLVSNWSVICWSDNRNETFPQPICNPNQPSDTKLLRCPNATYCQKHNAVWPNYTDYHKAVSIKSYDVSPYDATIQCTDESFRSYMEGFLNKHGADCGGNPMCIVYGEKNIIMILKLHNVIHTILGLGDVSANPPFNKTGVMGDGASSPNDPIFINHHTMVDCMLEEWIQRNKDDLDYPTSNRIRYGHRAEDYIVPFIPLYKNRDMLVTADNFGYSCSIPDSSTSLHTYASVTLIVSSLVLASLTI